MRTTGADTVPSRHFELVPWPSVWVLKCLSQFRATTCQLPSHQEQDLTLRRRTCKDLCFNHPKWPKEKSIYHTEKKTFKITPQGGLQVIPVQRPCKVISFKIICMKLVIICMVTTQIFSLTCMAR